jgi:predicted enzyme related to lactoylglutathione lyase
MKSYSGTIGWKLNRHLMDYVTPESAAVDERQAPTEPCAINGSLFERATRGTSSHAIHRHRLRRSSAEQVSSAGNKVVTPKTPIPGMSAVARIATRKGEVIACSNQRAEPSR